MPQISEEGNGTTYTYTSHSNYKKCLSVVKTYFKTPNYITSGIPSLSNVKLIPGVHTYGTPGNISLCS